MSIPLRVRLVPCLLVALGAGSVAALRVAPLGPWLEIDVVHSFERESVDIYDLRIVPHGGEVIDEVRVDVLRGEARVSQPAGTRGLGPDSRFQVRVNVVAGTRVPAAVRVTQRGRVSRIYDVELAEASR